MPPPPGATRQACPTGPVAVLQPAEWSESRCSIWKQPDASAFDAKQRAQVDKVSQYLSSVHQSTAILFMDWTRRPRPRHFYIQNWLSKTYE